MGRQADSRWARLLVATLAFLLFCVAAAVASVEQKEGLRVTVLSQIMPYKLPRNRVAPISVFVSGHVSNARGGIPPQLQEMTIEVNRHGLLQSRGLPVCTLTDLKATPSNVALRKCSDALVGSGQFWANIVFPDQGSYATRGRLLIFNGRDGKSPLLLAHIFTEHPFPTAFVIPFRIHHISKGPYGTELSASLPQALGDWGYLDRIKLTLRRLYRFDGAALSYYNAACPAPPGADRTAFSLALATFSFANGQQVETAVEKTCGVKESMRFFGEGREG
jgi:hypothetical protein